MQETLRAKFFNQFTATATKRMAACLAAVSADESKVALSELHSLAGEASMLGFEEIGALAREAEAKE